MAMYIGINRRSRERRLRDEPPVPDSRHVERRRFSSDNYVLVVGNGGVDRFGLLIGIPLALVMAGGVLGVFGSG